MSKNKDFIKFLKKIQYSSVSNINLKYNKVFKEFSVDTLIERNNFADSIHKKWIIEEEKKTKSKYITTNDKLKQIINSYKNISQIQSSFFKTFDKEPLFKQLIKKENVNNLIKKKKGIKEDKSDEKTGNKTKLKERDESYYKKRWEENNRKPPLGLYNPKYNYIEKHTPCFNFHNESSIPKKSITFKRRQETQKNDNTIKKSRNKNQANILNHSLTPVYKIKQNQEFQNSINVSLDKNRMDNSKFNSLTLNRNQENVFLSQLNLSSKEKTIQDENEKSTQLDYFPKILEKNINVPIFNKMSSRFKPKMRKEHITNVDYSPNYKAIYSGILDFKPIDYEERRKRSYLKKIITNYNQIKEYLLFPELNIIKKK